RRCDRCCRRWLEPAPDVRPWALLRLGRAGGRSAALDRRATAGGRAALVAVRLRLCAGLLNRSEGGRVRVWLGAGAVGLVVALLTAPMSAAAPQSSLPPATPVLQSLRCTPQ